MLSVLVRIDAAGETPLLVDDTETLCPAPGVRWRFVCEVEDRESGSLCVKALRSTRRYDGDQRRCDSDPYRCGQSTAY